MNTAFPKIVVVEDRQDILFVLRRLLRDLQLDHDIIAVDNGASALAHAAHHSCALLITDYVLHGMNGLELAREFKARWNSPVIMLSAYAGPEVRRAADLAGVDEFIAKPFFAEKLESAVRALLAVPA